MLKFAAKHYVPILTWKQAEQAALLNTPTALRTQFTPLIEIVPIPTDLDTGDPTRTLEGHIDPAIDKLVTSWGTTLAFFLDPGEVALDLSSTGTDGAMYVYNSAQARGLPFIPVTGIYRSATDIAAAFSHRQRGVCIRLFSDDLNNPSLPNDLVQFISNNNITPSDVDIVIDLDAVSRIPQYALASTSRALIQALPNITAWRTLTLAGCAFPDLTGVQGPRLFPRTEWLVWLQLYSARAALPRLPTFGDYVIQSPEGIDGYDPRFMPMTPAIRYTVNNDWLVIRGQSSKQIRLAQQYPMMAAQLVASSPPFYGANHSQGCADAAACASGRPGFGSPVVWRRIGTAHHLVVVTGQISALTFP